jgi:hypothetical protein
MIYIRFISTLIYKDTEKNKINVNVRPLNLRKWCRREYEVGYV